MTHLLAVHQQLGHLAEGAVLYQERVAQSGDEGTGGEAVWRYVRDGEPFQSQAQERTTGREVVGLGACRGGSDETVAANRGELNVPDAV